MYFMPDRYYTELWSPPLLYSNLFSATTATTVTVIHTATPNLIMFYAQLSGQIKGPAEQKGVREL